MASTARNMLKILYDRKCGAVVMLSDLTENGRVRGRQYHKLYLFIYYSGKQLPILANKWPDGSVW